MRHLYWDHANYGKQANKDTPLEVPAVETSSKILIGARWAARRSVRAGGGGSAGRWGEI